VRSEMMDDIRENRKRVNKGSGVMDGVGFGMMNGDENLKNFINTATIDVEGIESVLLLTDGMFLPKRDPDGEDEWTIHAQLYKDQGLTGLSQAVRELENEDPLCRIFPRYKKHDDASGVAIDF